MSVWSESAPAPLLRGVEGELLFLRITVAPHLLERLLETLARLEFPINPQICHDIPAGPGVRAAAVEFPAWAGRLAEVRAALRRVYYDTAASPYLYTDTILCHVLAWAPDKVLWGTDYPLLGMDRFLRRVRAVGLGEDTLAKLLGGNALAALGQSTEPGGK